MDSQVISCPQCGYQIPLTEAISHQIREELQREFDAQASEQQEKLKKKEKDLELKEQQLNAAKSEVEEEVAKRIKEEMAKVKEEAKKKAVEAVDTEIKDLSEQLGEKNKKIGEMQQAELELRKERRKLEADKEAFELEMTRKMDEERKSLSDQIKGTLEEQYMLKERDYQEKINGLTDQITDLKRRAEQGSQQAQGETLERQFEDDLREAFAQDHFEPVSIGKRGADIRHIVCDGAGRDCGSIIWEAKRTKNWSGSWVDKLKDDQRDAGADVAAIVSMVLPKEIKGIDFINGAWVSDYHSAIGLATALRRGLIEVAKARQAAVGKNEKMEILYDYLSGQGFRHRVEAIAEAFITMREDLEKEKTAIQRLWAKREKQLIRVASNTAGMYGDMQGIIGAAMPEIESLELKALAGETDIDHELEEGEIVP